jgi:hypothetical protein
MMKNKRLGQAFLLSLSAILPWAGAFSHHAASPYVAADAPRIGDIYMSFVFFVSWFRGFALQINRIGREIRLNRRKIK